MKKLLLVVLMLPFIGSIDAEAQRRKRSQNEQDVVYRTSDRGRNNDVFKSERGQHRRYYKPKKRFRRDLRPTRKHLWVSGYWSYDKRLRRDVWVSGYWARPNRRISWVPGHYERYGRSRVWVSGCWTRF